MNLQQLRARVKRLGELSTGLAKEEILWRKEMAFLMHSERALYLNEISRAQSAIEEARSTLAKICERLEEKDSRRSQ